LQGVTSRATILGDLLVKKSGAPQAIFSVDGTTGLFFRDGTNAAWKSWQIATSYNDGSDLSFIPSTNTSGTPTWGSTAMVIQGNGRVGIGVTTPAAALTIKELGISGAPILRFIGSVAGGDYMRTSWFSNGGTELAFINVDGTSTMNFGTNSSTPLLLYTNGTERFRITTGGAATELVKITNSLASGDPVNIQNLFTAQAPNNQGAQFLYCGDSSALRLKIVANGGIHNYQANNVNLSDKNTKKEISPLDSYWDKFKNIEIVKFKYKDQTHEDFNIGVIAQQVEEIAPEFVDTSMWDLEGQEVERKAIYTSDLHHATIKVLQEAMAKIESLEKEVEILKTK